MSAALCGAVVGVLVLPGCELAGVVASGMEETGSHKVFSEYEGLADKTYAVVVDADRSIQASWPSMVADVTARIDAALADGTNAAGHVPARDVVLFLQTNPRWTTMTRKDLAQALGGVDRIILIELFEFRVNEPGNRYVWDGVAGGSVAVLETDGPFPEEYAYHRPMSVRFPDKQGYGPDDFGASLVSSALVKRFAQRCAWLFIDHEEPNAITY